VEQLAVFPQRFAVVARQDDKGFLEPAALIDEPDKFFEFRVDVGHLARIEVFLEPAGVRLGRAVGGVRVPEMDPAEPLSPLLGQPGQGRSQDLFGRALGIRKSGGRPRRIGIVVDVKSLVEPEPRVQRKRADESARGVALGLKMLGQGLEFVGHDGLAVLADAVGWRRETQEDVGVGGKCQRRVGEGTLEKDPGGGQAVYLGRLKIFLAVTAQPVRAEGVDGHEKKVRVRPGHRTGEDGDKGEGREEDARPLAHPAF